MLEGTSLNFVFIFLHFFKIHILFYPFVMTSYCLTFRQTTFACYYGFPNNKRKWSSRIILTEAHTLFFITCPEEFKLYTWKLLEGARCHTRGLISKGWKWETVSCEKKRSSLWGVQCRCSGEGKVQLDLANHMLHPCGGAHIRPGRRREKTQFPY